jgi:hypothetical protein
VKRSNFVRFLAFIFGLLFALAGGGMLALAASGAVVEGQTGAYVIGSSLLAAAAPLLLVPVSARLAEVVAYAVFGGFAVAMLWAAFGSRGTTPSALFQVAAVLFGLLLLLRVVLAWRKKPGVGT